MTNGTLARIQGPHEKLARNRMARAVMCNAFTVDAVVEIARVADELRAEIDELRRENQELRALLERPRPPVAREQRRFGE